MRKKLITILSVLVLGFNPALTYAQSPTTTPTPSPATKSSVKDAMKQARTDMKEAVSQAREDFKTKLAAIKDQRKQAIMANFDAKIDEINARRTSQMTEHITRLQRVLDNISTKAAALKSQGQNTTTVDADILAAQTALDAAKQAVLDQAAKDYVVTITANLRGGASSTMRQFIADLKATFQKILAAKTAVRKAHTDMAKLMGVKVSPTASVSRTPTPSTTVTPTGTATPTP